MAAPKNVSDEVAELRAQLAEAEAALDAIRSGAADAFIGETGDVFQLADSERPYVTFFDAMNEGGVTLDAGGAILHGNPRFVDMVGRPMQELRGASFHSCVAARDHAQLVELLESSAAIAREVTLTSTRGQFPVRLSLQTVDTGPLQFRCLVVTDLSERTNAEAELRIAAIAFESQEGMVVTDPDGVIIRVNRAFCRLTGYDAEEVIGQKPSLLKSGRHDEAFYQLMWQSLLETGYWQGEIWNRRKSGNIYAEWLTISAVTALDGAVTHFVGAFSEITQKKEAQAEIHRLAYYDALTQLPNRRLLQDRIEQALASSRRSHCFGAILFLDLDQFKNLNDTRGHDVGDDMLIETAKRIQSKLREGDTVARLGGDEFVVMLEDLSTEAEEAALQAGLVGEKIREAIARPYDFGGFEFRSGASLGVTLFHGHRESVETLLRHADLAMYKAKGAGRNALRFFDPTMQTALDERSVLDADLRQAVERGQLHLHYQAQFDSTGRIIGVEALLRWVHPTRGLVPCERFIPLAEETGLIVPIGQWVLATACTQIKVWSLAPATRELQLAVNVSARQFHETEFVAQVRQVLNNTGADPTRLKIELTESMVIENLGETLKKMRALKALGICFSLDDFGTGYSSLSYLTRLPLDELKIDKSFVCNLPDNCNDAVIAQTIITMAMSLGLKVIAEGVETEAQREFLEHYRCNAYQGYLFSRPLPIEEFEQFAKRSRHRIVRAGASASAAAQCG